MSDIELVLNQHLTALRLVERALNDPTGWAFRTSQDSCAVQVTVSDFAVSFWGVLPAPGATIVTVDVLHQGELVWVRSIAVPDPAGRVELEWTFAVEQMNALS